MELFPDQQAALETVKKNPVCILTGGPGTGKTTVVKAMLDYFEKDKIRVKLGAPSGKAAKRLYECTGREAQTIHRILEPERIKGRFVFKRNVKNPIEADLITIDELSMVDTWLMARLLDATAPGTRLILVGDPDQLPSIGPGNVLKDMISCGLIPCTELTIIKRQDAGLIVKNCHRIKNAEDIEVENTDESDFLFIEHDSENAVHDTILKLVSRTIPQRLGVDPLREIQVIAPLRKRTALSCEALNAAFQDRLNPGPEPAGTTMRVGDKVIQTKNDYELEVINGDIGFVNDIDKKNRKIYVGFDHPQRLVEFSLWENDLQLAYAVTVHKFQGSEARVIVMPIHKCLGTFLMQRNLLYTAISRAQDLCVLVGQRSEIPKIIKRNQQQQRHTRLREMLQEA